MKSKTQKVEQAKKLLRQVRWQKNMMRCIVHTGFEMDNETFRMLLRNNPHINARWNQLDARAFRLERFIFKNA